MSLEKLASELEGMGEKAYRAHQVFEWLHRHNQLDFGQMSNLPKTLRARLAEAYGGDGPVVLERAKAKDAAKLLLRLSDGRTVESVRMGRPWGDAGCVSSQVGCPVGCTFCASGRDGLDRNLSAGEIVAQVSALRAEGPPVRRIVLMGMGEPLLNLSAVLAAVRILCDKRGFGIPERSVTLSTIGLVSGLRALAESGLRIRLTLSLHATDDGSRRELGPEWLDPLGEVLAAAAAYAESAGRRLTLAHVLLRGVNDSREDAERLAAMARSVGALVNVIPFNEVLGVPFERPSASRIEGFLAVLAEVGVRASVRRSVGRGAEAACGQLRSRRSAEAPCAVLL